MKYFFHVARHRAQIPGLYRWGMFCSYLLMVVSAAWALIVLGQGPVLEAMAGSLPLVIILLGLALAQLFHPVAAMILGVPVVALVSVGSGVLIDFFDAAPLVSPDPLFALSGVGYMVCMGVLAEITVVGLWREVLYARVIDRYMTAVRSRKAATPG